MKNFFYFFLLGFFVLIIGSLPSSMVEKLRGMAVTSLAPMWKVAFSFRAHNQNHLKANHLALENTLLRSKVEGFSEWLLFDQRIDEQIQLLKSISNQHEDDYNLREFFRRRSEEIKNLLEKEIQSLPANVIFRGPTSWNSSLWIDVGERDNEYLGKQIIAKNSPVVLGDCLIGVVEYVARKKSRVRLLTDSGFVPSVRATRGRSLDLNILKQAKLLYDLISSKKNLSFLSYYLSEFIQGLEEEGSDKYLATGELYGSSHPLWKIRGQTLKGVGFRYDFEESQKNSQLSEARPPPLERGDLLITTGFDGVFPPGLKVAFISKVNDLKEGDYTYSIEAKPAVSNLDDLRVVFVLPPMEF